MPLFLLTFLLIYGTFHLYAFMKARAAVGLGPAAAILLAFFMLVMIAAPVIIRLAEKSGFEESARLAAYLGFTWMGILFVFVCTSLLLDIYNLLSAAGSVIIPAISRFRINRQMIFSLPLVVSLLVAVYGFLEAWNIRIEELVIRTPKIPAEIGTLRIAQISDVHLGLIVGDKRLQKILAAVKNTTPDILVSTGDLIDGQSASLSGLTGLFQEITPRYGKYAVTGNHEYYAGLEQALDFTRAAGFTVLRGEGTSVGPITLSGVDDITGERFGQALVASEKEMLSSLPAEKFTVLLKHRPVIAAESPGLFDLQLSGHTHNGQIFPFNLLSRLFFPINAGFMRTAAGSNIYVSRGSGTWGPPIRFLAPPEVTLIKLVHEPAIKK